MLLEENHERVLSVRSEVICPSPIPCDVTSVGRHGVTRYNVPMEKLNQYLLIVPDVWPTYPNHVFFKY